MADTTLRQQLAAGATSVLALLTGAGSAHAQSAADGWLAIKPVPLNPDPAADLNRVYRGTPPAGVAQMPIEACAAKTRLNPQTKQQEVVLGKDGKPEPVMPNRNSGMCFSAPHVPDPAVTKALLQGPVRAFATAATGIMNSSSLNIAANQPAWRFVGGTQAPAADGQGVVDLGIMMQSLGHDFDRKGTNLCVTSNGWLATKNHSKPEEKVQVIPVVTQVCSTKNVFQ